MKIKSLLHEIRLRNRSKRRSRIKLRYDDDDDDDDNDDDDDDPKMIHEKKQKIVKDKIENSYAQNNTKCSRPTKKHCAKWYFKN